MNPLPPILISDQDLARIERVLETLPAAGRESHSALWRELERAEVVPVRDMPPDVVTMNSRVAIELDGTRRELALAYPGHAGPGRVSVLAPAGTAILGLRVGDEIRWPVSEHHRIHVNVSELLYQPERAGDLHR